MAARTVLVSALASVLLTACQGVIGAPPDDAVPAAPGASPGPGPRVGPSPRPTTTPSPSPSPDACAGATLTLTELPLRRLSSAQYAATVRELLGDPGFDAPLDDDAAVITERGVRQLRDAAEHALSRKASWTAPVFPCDPAGAPDEACAAQLIATFGGRAFRRPLTTEEQADLLAVYRAALPDQGFGASLEVLVEVILQSPQVVYLDEGKGTLPAGAHRLDGWGLASRLSYFLWDTMPDEALFQAAAAGRLSSPAALRAEAERMLADPRAARTIERFVWRWLQLDGGRLHHSLESAIKDGTLFPEYGPELQAAMRTELEAFVRRVVLEDDGGFDALLNSRWAYVNGPLAALYGLRGGPTAADTWAWVELDEGQRRGLLTRAAFLTVFGSAKVQSPIRRGVFVLEELLCSDLGDPPPNANDVPVVGGPVDVPGGTAEVRTVRQDVEVRTQGAECAGCHGLINPTGFALEHYDAIGRFRTTELGTGLPIDARGALRGSDVDGPLADARELSARLGASQRARSCFARRWASAALGQPLASVDACFVQATSPAFFGAGSVRDLLLDLVASEAFGTVISGGQN
jgi:hypothetical protein